MTDHEVFKKIIPALCVLLEIHMAISKEEVKQQIVELKQELVKLEHRLKRLEAELVVGQVAYDVDRGVPHFVLDAFIDPDHHIYTIYEMNRAIMNDPDYGDVFKTQETRARAEARWETLKEEFHWTSKLHRYMKHLKTYYNIFACPTVDKDTVENVLESQVIPDLNRELFEKLWTIHCLIT